MKRRPLTTLAASLHRRVVEPVITGFGEARPSYGFGLPILPVFAVEGRFWP